MHIRTIKLELWIFILFISIILIVPSAFAVGFSPSSLIFDLDQKVRECKTITINSDSSKIIAFDKWGEHGTVEWKANAFNTTSSEHGITIDYDNELSEDERKADVCLSGEMIGEHRGIIIFQQQQEGNSIIQIGVWLKVTISGGTNDGKVEEVLPSQTLPPSGMNDEGIDNTSFTQPSYSPSITLLFIFIIITAVVIITTIGSRA